MERNKIIIIALIILIAALLVGIVAMMMPNLNKQDANLVFKSKSKITEGGSLQVQLTSDNGEGIADQTVNVTFTDSNGANYYYSVLTNDNGVGKLKLDKKPGKYSVTISYDGNDVYSSCNSTKNIKIEKKEVEATSSETQSSQPSAYAYRSDGSPMYSQAEVDQYMLNKYGMVDYHVGSNGYIDMDEPGYDDAGNPIW